MIKKGTSLLSLLKEEDRKKYFCATVNGKMRELTYQIESDGDYDIKFCSLENSSTIKIYTASIRYLVSMACKIVAPKLELRFYDNVSRSIFCKIIAPKNYSLDAELVGKIEKKMNELVDLDLPLIKCKISKEEAIQIHQRLGFKDKIQILKYRTEDFVHLYHCACEEIDFYNYLYSPMVPSTGYLTKFKLKFYAPGFIIQVPRSECGGEIPEFIDEKSFARSLQTTSHWQEMNKLDTAYNINKFIKTYSPLTLINICETRINDMLCELGKKITKSYTPIRLICVAGPSSSGKTSFANRLMFELMTRGLRPIRISMDDYYLPDDVFPEGVSVESVDALDIAYFDKQMDELIRGKTVVLPKYDFSTHKRSDGKKIFLQDNQPIIIEGIHALNSSVCANINAEQKYKVYIAPHPQINIDNHTPMSMTDMRLLRRIARDDRTRGTDAINTIGMWASVREGEFKYIYPTQNNADFVFDSFMPYEISALRNIVLPQLKKITPDQDGYLIAKRLKNMVKYFLPIPIDDIPSNSLMREFVGGSSFKDAR